MSRSTWLTILLVVICAGVAFAVYTRMHSAALLARRFSAKSSLASLSSTSASRVRRASIERYRWVLIMKSWSWSVEGWRFMP